MLDEPDETHDDETHDEAHDEAPPYGDLRAAAEAFEHLPFVAVVTDGPELRTVAVNAAARAMTGGRLRLGVPLTETLPPELVGQGWVDAYAAPTSTGETVVVDEARMQVLAPGGEVREVYLDSVFTPRPGADGRPRGTILTASDVTQRVQDRATADRGIGRLRDRYAAASGSVRAMQRALLADSVPVLPDFDVAARYVLASDEQAAGGDWFDAVPRRDGSVVLVVGDVVGHGQQAAVAMGQLRSVLLAQLRAGHGVEESLRLLDGFAASVPEARRATVCVVLLEGDGEASYCTAGHPPPLLLATGGGGPRYLPPSGAGPLGTGSGFEVARARVGLGEAVVLYSDGLLERPGTTAAAASVELRDTARDAQLNVLMPAGAPASAAERICSLSIELLTRRHGHTDDITVLAAERREPVPPLDLGLAVGADTARSARAAVRAWLDGLGVATDRAEPVLHAVTELVANAVDHAYLGTGGPDVRLRARLGPDGVVTVEVADRGHWRVPMLASGRGRGLALVHQLVDELKLDRSADGTTAVVHHAVDRTAGFLSPPTPAAADVELFDVWTQGGPEPVVTVVGPLDDLGADEASAHLTLALVEAATTVVVDLGQVTLLASAGVDRLFALRAQAHGLGLGVVLVAPNGSPAQQVLGLVGLTHQEIPPAR